MGIFDGMMTGLGGGIVSAIGGLFSNQAQKDIAQQSMQFSAEQAQKQMDFQERMRATQYQTAVDDLKKADLNPMLAYTQGGAGTPVGAAAVGQQANIENPLKGFAHNAAAAAAIKADLELKNQQTTNVVADTSLKEASAKTQDTQQKLNILNMSKVDQETKNLVKQELLIDAQKDLNSAQAGAAHEQAINTAAETTLKRQQELINKPEVGKSQTWWGRNISPYMKDISQGVNSATGAARIGK